MSTSGGTAGQSIDALAIEQGLPSMLSLLATRPNDRALRKQVETMTHHVAHRQAFEDFATTLDGIAGEADDTVEINRTLGRIMATHLGRPTDAIAYYESVLEDIPEDVDALVALENLYSATGAASSLLDVCGRLVELVDDARRKAALQTKMAAIHTNDGEQSKAEKLLKSAAKVDRNAFNMLRDLYESAEQWGKLADLLDDHPSQNANDILRLAAVKVSQGKHGDAVTHLSLLLGTPHDKIAVDKMLELMDTDAGEQVAITLQPVFERAGNKQQVLACIEKRIECESGDRGALLWEAWQAHNSFDALLRILNDNPADIKALRKAETQAANYGMYSRLLEAVDREDAPLETLLWMAGLYNEIGDTTKAATAYTRALKVEESEDVLLRALDVYRAAGLTKKEVSTLRSLVAVTSTVKQKVQYLLQLAAVKDDAYVYEQIFALQPNNEAAFQFLLSHYRKNENWDKLLDLLSTRSHVSEMRLLAANVYDYELEQYDKALDIYSELVSADPTNAQVVRHLERLHREGIDVYGLLKSTYETTNSYPQLIKLIEGHASECDDVEASALHLELASIYRKIGQPKGDFQHRYIADSLNFKGDSRLWSMATTKSQKETLRKLYNDKATRTSDLLNLGDLCLSIGKREDARTAYARAFNKEQTLPIIDKLLQVETDEGRKHTLLVSRSALANSAEAHLDVARSFVQQDNMEEAAAMFRRALDTAPSIDTAAAMLDAYSKAGDLANVGYAYTVLARFDTDSKTRTQSLMAAAEAFSQAGDHGKEIATYESVYQIDKSQVALDALEELYRDVGNDAGLVKTLRRKADHDAYDYCDIMLALANEYRRLGDDTSAINALRQTLHSDPGHQGVRAALHTLLDEGVEVTSLLEAAYVTTRDYDKAAELYERRLKSARKASERVEVLHTIVDLRMKAGDRTGAFTAVKDLYLLDPTTESRLLSEVGPTVVDKNDILDVLDAGMALHGKTVDRLTTAAMVAEHHGLTSRCAEYHRAIIAIDRRAQRSLDYLDKLYTDAGNHSALITILEAKAVVGNRLDSLLRIGRSLLTLGEFEEACSQFKHIIDEFPHNAEAAESYKRLLKKANRWRELSEYLEKELKEARG